jgi:hypothetical protein
MTSLSTRFFGQPRLTKPTFVGAVGAIVAVWRVLASADDRVFTDI